jgi:RNA polymerase sigma factor (sigma-70 family)
MTITQSSSVTVDQLLGQAAWARRLAGSLLGDPSSGDDLVQDTWIASSHAPPDTGRPLGAWMREVLRNRALNRARDQRRLAERHERAVEGEATGTATATGPDELVERMQVQRLMAELVTALPEPIRQTVLLRYYEGLSSPEIAEVMAVPAGSVRRRLKEGVEALRVELDRRHGGRREDWLRALVPLAPAGAARTAVPAAPLPVVLAPSAKLVAVLGGVVVLVAVVLLAWLGRGAGDGGIPPGPPAFRAGGDNSGPPGGRLPAVAAAPTTMVECRTRLAKLRQELVVGEAAYRRSAPPPVLFDEGEPNAQAREVLLPLLTQVMGGDGGVPPDFSLECRTWVCKMLVTEPTDAPRGSSNRWMQPLQADQGLRLRIPGKSFQGGMPTKDPLSGVALYQRPVFLVLADPSAEPAPVTIGKPPTPKPDTRPLPDQLAPCQRELAAGEARLLKVRAAAETNMPPFDRFDRSPANPALTREIKAIIDQALRAGSGPALTAEVECHARICVVNVPGAPDNNVWRRQLHQAPEFARYNERSGIGPKGTFYTIGDPTRPQGEDLMKKLLANFDASPALPDCEKRFPAQGRAELRFNLPGEGELNDDGQPGKISARMGGTVAGTPLGKCLQEEIERRILSAELPAGVKGVAQFKKYDFPRAAGGTGAVKK